MLTFVDVKFTSIVHVKKIKGCSGLQIYSKLQMMSSFFFRKQVVFLLRF